MLRCSHPEIPSPKNQNITSEIFSPHREPSSAKKTWMERTKRRQKELGFFRSPPSLTFCITTFFSDFFHALFAPLRGARFHLHVAAHLSSRFRRNLTAPRSAKGSHRKFTHKFFTHTRIFSPRPTFFLLLARSHSEKA
jgi:hypothetical protein